MHELAEEIVRQHVTVTGVQPKLSLDLQRQNGANRLTLVGLWGRYILKPPYALYPAMPEIEDLTMHLATHFGIGIVPHVLIRLQTGELAYLTRRIDRDEKGRKFAMEDCCQLAEKVTADKYKGSMELVGRLVKKYSTQAGLDALTLFEVTLFCFLTGNADMHLKNFSLWEKNGFIALTPAYDLLATKLLLPSDPEELALSMNGRKSRLQLNDWHTFANYLGLTERQRVNVFTRFNRQLPEGLEWVDKSFLSTQMKTAYKDLIQDRASRLGLTIH
ncbi:type II toxin-antitoxin system HipA family toxin [Rudanella paleaurantiibacter]|uniref:Type II toxin-antitoxin system HipA family toxin n=2 Tax=Rudanella paleaurantiibacter TaxID=2614655 RepID=A0A7J5U6G0_9BACT|nr:type II toxin-antitoxin system HipA family toxin [Rudanella paleaurantiibacter]